MDTLAVIFLVIIKTMKVEMMTVSVMVNAMAYRIHMLLMLVIVQSRLVIVQ